MAKRTTVSADPFSETKGRTGGEGGQTEGWKDRTEGEEGKVGEERRNKEGQDERKL